jgi:hypothetical protein
MSLHPASASIGLAANLYANLKMWGYGDSLVKLAETRVK